MAKRLLTILALCGLAVYSTPKAQAAQDQDDIRERSDARDARRADARELQALQYDLENLDLMMQGVDARDPRYGELQQRLDWLREDVAKIQDRLQRSRGREIDVSDEQVQRMRQDVASLERDITRSSERHASETVPQGTEMDVRLEETLSSRSARPEDRVVATVARPVVAEGRIVIPAGTRVEGTVADVQPATEHPSRRGRLDVDFDRVVLDDGRVMPVSARVVSLGDDERFNRRSAERTGIGALLGGVLGSVIGGGRGAIVGAIVGGAGGFVSSPGSNVSLPAGTLVTLRLERPIALADWTDRRD